MNRQLSRFLSLACVLLVLALITAPSAATAAPDNLEVARNYFRGKTIDLNVPGSPGGGTDIPARLIAPFFEKALEANVLVHNLNAAGGAVCYMQTAMAPPNGLTMALVTVPLFATTHLTGGNTFNPVEDYDYLGRLLYNPQVVIVSTNSPFQTLEDVIEYARANPEELSWAGVGATSLKTLIGQTFRNFGANFRTINWDGDNECIVALMGGHVDISCVTFSSLGEYIESGDLRALATIGSQRLEAFPDVPSTDELGYHFPLNSTVQGLVVPKNNDPAQLTLLQTVFRDILHDDEFRKTAAGADLTLLYGEPEVFRTFVKDTLEFLKGTGLY